MVVKSTYNINMPLSKIIEKIGRKERNSEKDPKSRKMLSDKMSSINFPLF